MMTAPDPETGNKHSLFMWAVGLTKDLMMATNGVLWQAAIDSVARVIESGDKGLDLTEKQRMEVVRWIRSQDSLDDL